MKNIDVYNIFYDQGLSYNALDFIECSKMTPYKSFELGIKVQSVMQIPYSAKQVVNQTNENGMCEKIKLQPNFKKEVFVLRNIQQERKSSREFTEKITIDE